MRGIYQLAKHEQIQDIAAAQGFVGQYGIIASGNWTRDLDQVFSARERWIRDHMRAINQVRHTWLAHLQQDAPIDPLPSIAAFEELLAFAFGFHWFVNEAFLSVVSHPILDDRRIASSLLSVLKKMGMSHPVLEFEDI